jgi:hypothetical protein
VVLGLYEEEKIMAFFKNLEELEEQKEVDFSQYYTKGPKWAGGEDSWFTNIDAEAFGSQDVETQEAMRNSGGGNYLIANNDIDPDKTYTIDEVVGDITEPEWYEEGDDSYGFFAFDTEEEAKAYFGDEAYQKSLNMKKVPIEYDDETYNFGEKGPWDPDSEAYKYTYGIERPDQWNATVKQAAFNEIKAGNNENFYYDDSDPENPVIRAKRTQATITGYDGGILSVQGSGIK